MDEHIVKSSYLVFIVLVVVLVVVVVFVEEVVCRMHVDVSDGARR